MRPDRADRSGKPGFRQARPGSARSSMSSIPPWSAGNASPATLGPGAGNAFGVQGRAPVAGERRPAIPANVPNRVVSSGFRSRSFLPPARLVVAIRWTFSGLAGIAERRPWPLRDGSGVCIVLGLTVIGWNGIHLAEVARGVPIEKVGAATGERSCSRSSGSCSAPRTSPRSAGDWAGTFGDIVAVDGKAVRRSFEDAANHSPLHLVQAFATEARLTPGQVEVGGKSNPGAD